MAKTVRSNSHAPRFHSTESHLGNDPRPLDPEFAAGNLAAAAIPIIEPEDRELPTTTELAQALGLDELALHEDVRDDERQRHPGVSDDPEDDGDRDAQAREFQHRLASQ